MRRSIVLGAALFSVAWTACSTSESGPASSGTTSSSVGSSAVTSTATSTPAPTSTSTSSPAASAGGSSGSSSSEGCGADTCGGCPCGYVATDHCVNGSWQCACSMGSASTSCAANGSSSSGGTSSASCGPDSCASCPAGCQSGDVCEGGRWLCACGCVASMGSVASSSSSSSSSGGASTAACDLDGGATLVGSWSGMSTVTETFGRTGTGGGGRDTEDVVATDGGIEFQDFFTFQLAGCDLPFTLTGPTSATVVPSSVCTGASGGTWTFNSGTATLDSTGCVMTVQTAGTLNAPGSGAGTFTTSSTLDLQ